MCSLLDFWESKYYFCGVIEILSYSLKNYFYENRLSFAPHLQEDWLVCFYPLLGHDYRFLVRY